MKIHHLTALLLAVLLYSCSAGKEEPVQSYRLVPYPTELTPARGYFVFTRTTHWQVEDEEQRAIASLLCDAMQRTAGFAPTLSIAQGQPDGEITCTTDTTLAPEAYRLAVTPRKIRIEASAPAGFFYATQTLRQMLPASVSGVDHVETSTLTVPAVEITDEPRFAYRGVMLDVARYFIPKEEIMRIIDATAMLKLNKLHLHLVDDNGWRLEIKRFPRLTEVGAWRVPREEFFSARPLQQPGEATTEGGFYTQEEMRQIIDYASARSIEVIPEIEMPAHSNAALASYPELACQTVKGPITVITGIGGHNADIIFCAGNDSTFSFLEGVIDEVAELFPSRYIHLGGDEAAKTHWNQCPRCQARLKREHLPNTEELQGWFMKRMCNYVRSKGKQPMGWDELTNSTLPDSVIVYGWQGYGDAALKAARQGHRFVMTPARILYLIRYQGPQWFEPRSYFGNNTLADVYNYNPVQADWTPEITILLMGIQGSLWTEFCKTETDVEHQLFPRLAALAEAAWVQPNQKNWSRFLTGLDNVVGAWDAMGIHSARSMYNLDHIALPDSNHVHLALNCIRPDVTVRYTTDGTNPTFASDTYSDTLTFFGPVTVKAATFGIDGTRLGEVLTLPVNFNKVTGKRIEASPSAERLYVLTNGLRGSDKHSDFEWAGWYNTDFTLTIDLGQPTPIHHVSTGSVTNYGMGVVRPATIELSLSDDGKDFHTAARIEYPTDSIFAPGIFLSENSFKGLNEQARYVRLAVTNPGSCPESHVRQGLKTWVYLDEIIVE